MGRSKSSDSGHPAAAYNLHRHIKGENSDHIRIITVFSAARTVHMVPTSMANRACLISASRYSINCSLLWAKPNGSNPKFPAISTFCKTVGHAKNGNARDMVRREGVVVVTKTISSSFLLLEDVVVATGIMATSTSSTRGVDGKDRT
jgi:hypothetical protein